jgi:hypothetical protein
MTMDARTRFKSGRSRPPAAPADDGDDWDAVIARAKMKAASLGTPIPLLRRTPTAGYAALEMQVTPPPVPRAPMRARVPERTKATLDALMQGGLHSAASLRPVYAPRRQAEAEMVTPPPVAKPRWAARPTFGPTKRY